VKELLYHIVIPARMAAERLPGKPLAELAGRPLIEHVYRRARAASARSVVIATDDDRIRRVAEAFGADVVMTSDRHKSGSDRIAAQMASLYWPLEQASQINDPNCVKVVVAADGAALLFSRSVIPYPRQWAGVQAGLDAGARWLRHIGLYAYRAGALQAFSQREPTPLECMEKLEQLRVLESGGRIRMAQACSFIPAGVDTPDDLERIRKHLARNGDGSRDTARQTG
jgi:3-deoxy-manno-octulosonate cytidylyltransferase (CMP-KDO synthetase)